MSYLDNYTLDEIAANDLEMLRDAIKNAYKYKFYDLKKAMKFVGACVRETLIALGLPNFERIPKKLLAKIQKQKKIRVEHRTRYKGENLWRCGIYIYKDDVLVAFISEIMVPEKNQSLISIPFAPINNRQEFHVITNAKVG